MQSRALGKFTSYTTITSNMPLPCLPVSFLAACNRNVQIMFFSISIKGEIIFHIHIQIKNEDHRKQSEKGKERS